MSQLVVNNDHVDKDLRKLRTPPKDSCHLQQFLSPQAVKNIYEASPTIRRPLQVIHSPRNFSTPKKFNDASSKETSSIISYTYKALPKYTTPPSQGKFVVTNPFDADLKNKLHLPIFSPSVFNTCVSPTKESQESFCWTIDDLSNIHPAPIDEKFLEIGGSVFSPETESRTQQAIDSYFGTTNPALQSPWPAAATRTKSFCPTLDFEAEEFEAEDVSFEPQPCHASTQTELSLPPVLPPELELALKPFFTQSMERHELDVDSGLETSSSRRKLFEPAPLSPVQASSALKHGLLYWPNLLRSTTATFDSRGSPFAGQRSQRSPSVSPVASASPAPASQRKASASARLDFSDQSMSIDRSFSAKYSFFNEDVSMTSRPATPARPSLR